MVEIYPFRGYVYNGSRVRFDDVLAPPYDKIDDPSVFHTKSPYNVAHIIRPDAARGPTPEERYRQGARLFADWVEAGVVVRESTVAMYPYQQIYTLGGKSYTRKGLVCLLRLEKPGGQKIRLHERTRPGPKEDRLILLRETRSHFGQIFFLYKDPGGKVEGLVAPATEGPPRVQGMLEGGVIHRLWALTDKERITAVTHALEEACLYVADGHHRYETAWAYRGEVEATRGNVHYHGSAGFRMVTLVNTCQSALHILATHRVLRTGTPLTAAGVETTLGEFFRLRRYPFTGDSERARAWQDFWEDLRIEGTVGPTIGVVLEHSREFLLLLPLEAKKVYSALPPEGSAARRELDVAVLHELVLPRLGGPQGDAPEIDYYRDPHEAVAEVASGRAKAAFLLNPTRLEQVIQVADEGDRMPAKSTDFFPKLASGIVMHQMED